MKNLTQAIEYILTLKGVTLTDKHDNFAQFESNVYGCFEIMFDYSCKRWMAYRERGKAIAPTQQLLFYFD